MIIGEERQIDMAEIERVIKDLEKVKDGIEWDSPLEYQIMIDRAIHTIRELQEDCNRYYEWGMLEGYEDAKEQMENEVCEWKLFDEEANAYDTSCENAFFLEVGTPEYNNMKYCPYCGRKIKVVE